MTGWYDFAPRALPGGGYHAFSEYFMGGRPVTMGNPMLEGRMIVAAFGPSMEEAEARRDRDKLVAERLSL